MRKLSSSKLFIAFGALAFVIAGAACSDSDTKPDTVTPKEAGAETAPPKEAGAETAPPTEAGVETAPPTEAGAETAPTEAGTEGGGGDAAPSASFSFNLEGSQQVPPVTTTATGTAKAGEFNLIDGAGIVAEPARQIGINV